MAIAFDARPRNGLTVEQEASFTAVLEAVARNVGAEWAATAPVGVGMSPRGAKA